MKTYFLFEITTNATWCDDNDICHVAVEANSKKDAIEKLKDFPCFNEIVQFLHSFDRQDDAVTFLEVCFDSTQGKDVDNEEFLLKYYGHKISVIKHF